jgi:hypothetical protein
MPLFVANGWGLWCYLITKKTGDTVFPIAATWGMMSLMPNLTPGDHHKSAGAAGFGEMSSILMTSVGFYGCLSRAPYRQKMYFLLPGMIFQEVAPAIAE